MSKNFATEHRLTRKQLWQKIYILDRRLRRAYEPALGRTNTESDMTRGSLGNVKCHNNMVDVTVDKMSHDFTSLARALAINSRETFCLQ